MHFHHFIYLQSAALDVVKQFLSARVYADAPNQTLSENEWEYRKTVMYLKSVFFQAPGARGFTSVMKDVC